jgi:uncharacterized protein (TIGR02421 family)
MSTIPASLAHHAELDRRMVAAVKGLRLLSLASWPLEVQSAFLDAWHRGDVRMPEVAYPALDFGDTRRELAVIAAACDGDDPVGQYLLRSVESWDLCAALLERLGTPAAGALSVSLFGKPGDMLPGSEVHNLDAAEHFIGLAGELAAEAVISDSDYCIPAEILRAELQEEIDRTFVHHRVSVEIDPQLVAKAAAGPTRIRLRGATCFTEYDRRQLLEHEAFVHTLTALNGREQPHLGSLGLSSPRTTATQEGLATFAELITGSIDIQRMKRISLRIVAIDCALGGADFIEVFRMFLEAGQNETESFTSAMRVFRGVPLTGGSAFTKDTVYLHGLLSVHTFFRWALRQRRLKLCQHLFAGKMTLHDVLTLEPCFDSGFVAEPMYLPHWIRRANGLAGILAFSLFANRIPLDRVVAEDLVLAV